MSNAKSISDQLALGADKSYDTKSFVADCRKLKVTSHVAQKKHSKLDGRLPPTRTIKSAFKNANRSKKALTG